MTMYGVSAYAFAAVLFAATTAALGEDYPPCGDPDLESCYESHEDSPGCNYGPCCEFVCQIDTACCDDGWDSFCVDLANSVGETPCLDCNDNHIPDQLEIADGSQADCNNNGLIDDCEINAGDLSDCNGDGVPDECELDAGTSPDCNGNGILDECDVSGGFSEDCNGDDVPDECELTAGTSTDCNENGILDECDLIDGVSSDCNENDILDVCDISNGTSADGDCNDVPDDCEGAFDCNGNESPDDLDIASGLSSDLDGDGIPDECEGAMDVVFVLDVTASKASQNALLARMVDDLRADDSLIRTAIDRRSNEDVRFGLVSYKDQVFINQVLTSDRSAFINACEQLFSPGGGDGEPEASDRALLEVLLEGGANSCDSDPDCCHGSPEQCQLPSVCINDFFFPRFDVPFREEAGRLAIHLSDSMPGGCDDWFVEGVDDVFANRIADLAGEKGVRIIAIADGEEAWEFSRRYADASNGAVLARCSFNEPISIESVAASILGIDFGGGSVIACPADLDGDGQVGGPDLTFLLSSWGQAGDSLPGDLNGDGQVGGPDLTFLLAKWGPCS